MVFGWYSANELALVRLELEATAEAVVLTGSTPFSLGLSLSTPFVCKPQRGTNRRFTCLITGWGLLFATLLRAKPAISSTRRPLFFPMGDPRAEGLALAVAWVWGIADIHQHPNSEKHLWLDSL